MAKKVTIQGTLQNLTDAWGGVSDGVTPVFGNVYPAGTEWGMNRGEVERFIKSQFDTKIGWILLSSEKVEGFYHIYTFRSQAEAVLWALDPEQYSEYLLNDIPIPISDVQGTTYSLRLATNSNRERIVSVDGNVVLGVKLTSTKQDTGQTAQDNPVTATLNIYGRGNSSASWALLGTRTIDSVSQESTTYQNVDISELVPSDNNGYQVRLIAVVNTEEFNATSNTIQFNSITKTKLRLEFAYDWHQPVQGGDNASVTIPYFIGGTVNKVLKVKLSRRNGQSVVQDTFDFTIGESTNLTTPYSRVNISDNRFLGTHGVLKVEAWLELADDSTIRSETLVNSIMVVTDSSDSTPHLLLQNVKTTLTNYVSEKFLEYAIYSTADSVPLDFMFGNLSGGALVPNVVHLHLSYDGVETNKQLELINTIEIEDNINDTIDTFLRITSNGVNLLGELYGSNYITITVDNTEKFAPTIGAVFVLNPKTRNNNEANPARILNAADDDALIPDCQFSGFAFMDGVDGWTRDNDNQQCLRMPAGRFLTIPYEIFSEFIRTSSAAKSITLELDFAVRNVADENTPIFSICTQKQGKPLGIEMNPLDGVFMTTSKSVKGQQNFAWQEGVRTRIAFNVVHNLRSDPNSNLELPYVRIFINGVINREFMFNSASTHEEFVQRVGDVFTSGGIRIGQQNSDIDIYSIRFYQGGLSSNDILQDYTASLPSAEEKLAFRSKNSIYQNESISYSLAQSKYNVIVWHGRNVSNHSAGDKIDSNGWLYIQQLNDDLTIDTAHSGSLTNLTMKGQGTSAKNYYEWNIQVQWKDKNNGTFTNLNGEVKGQKYQLRTGDAWAKKLVGKINYASSMQSHKQGATAMYNDLYRRICAGDKLMLSENPAARVAVIEKAFLYFVQNEGDAEPVFQGLMTFGAGKMDKPTWGYNEDDYPNFVMLEGADNNAELTDMRTPWDDRVTYDPDEESFVCEGVVSLDFDAGRTQVVTTELGDKEYPLDEDIVPYKNAWNFLYEHNPFVTYFEGSLAQLKRSNDVDTQMQYWVRDASAGVSKGDLFRYAFTGEYLTVTDDQGNETQEKVYDWIPAKRRVGNSWVAENVISVWSLTDSSDLETMNQSLIAKRVSDFKDNIANYFFVTDLLFHHEFIKLVAGTDNRSKNTYYVNSPNKSGQYRIALHQDDLDTIFLTNNVGWQSKPYYVEEQDPISDLSNYDGSELSSSYHWEGQRNVLFRLTELAYPTELPAMMATILDEMAKLVTEDDIRLRGYSKTPYGCFQKYFFSVQEYFPAVAYNETARIRYETAQLAVQAGTFSPSRNVQPITQSLGDQLECEKEYIKRRVAYISGYASYGEFGVGGTNGMNFQGTKTPEGNNAAVSFELTPHQYVYPTGSQGVTIYKLGQRLPALMTRNFGMGSFSGDTEAQLNGINYYRSIGNCSKLSINQEFTLLGSRLVEFVAEPAQNDTAWFRPPSMVIGQNVKLLKLFNIRNCSSIGGELNLSNQTRLQKLDLHGTRVNSLILPKTNTLVSVDLPATLTSVTIDGQPNIGNTAADANASFSIEGLDYVRQIKVVNNPYIVSNSDFKEYLISAINRPANSENKIMYLELDNLDMTMSVPIFDKMLDIEELKLKGTIRVTNTQARTFDFDLMWKMLNKLPTANVEGSGLTIIVSYVALTDAIIAGDDYISETGQYQYKIIPTPVDANKITKVEWSIYGAGNKASINPITGVLTVNSLNQAGDETKIIIKATISRVDDTDLEPAFEVGLYYREAQVGDFVYADGTWSDQYNPFKTVVGICWYSKPEDNDRRLVCVKDITTGGSIYGVWGMASDSPSGVTLQDNPNYSVYNIAAVPDEQITTGNITAKQSSQALIAWAYENIDGVINKYDVIPRGRMKTLAIIQHRNRLIEDSAFEDLHIYIPKSYMGLSETEDLKAQISAVQSNATDIGLSSSYYKLFYPAASMCYAYEPTVKEGEALHDKFKSHNWYLPEGYELRDIAYYAKKGYTEGVEDAIFAKAYNAGVFNQINESQSNQSAYQMYGCSDERNSDATYGLRMWGNPPYFGITGYTQATKGVGYIIRPCCSF